MNFFLRNLDLKGDFDGSHVAMGIRRRMHTNSSFYDIGWVHNDGTWVHKNTSKCTQGTLRWYPVGQRHLQCQVPSATTPSSAEVGPSSIGRRWPIANLPTLLALFYLHTAIIFHTLQTSRSPAGHRTNPIIEYSDL